MKKSVCFLLSCILCLAVLTGCNGGDAGGKKSSDPADDAPASTDYVAVIDGEKVYRTDFLYLFSVAVNSACREASGYPSSGSAQEKYDFMNTFMFREENGATPFQKAVDDTLHLCRQLAAILSEAREKGALMTEGQKNDFFTSIDEQINYNMSVTSDESLDSRDKVCLHMTGMNVNEYKRFALMQKNAEDYAAELMEQYVPSEEAISAFYQENQSDYEIRTIRKIFIAATEDGEGKKKAEEVYDLVKNKTYPMSVIATGWSEESNAVETSGLYDVLPTDTVLDPAVKDWAMRCTAPVEAENAAFFDIEGLGYYIVTCERIHDYETSETMQEAVLKGLREELLWEYADSLLDSGAFELTEFSREEMEKAAKAFLEDENPSK